MPYVPGRRWRAPNRLRSPLAPWRGFRTARARRVHGRRADAVVSSSELVAKSPRFYNAQMQLSFASIFGDTHGTQIFENGISIRQKGDAQAQARYIAQRPQRQEG